MDIRAVVISDGETVVAQYRELLSEQVYRDFDGAEVYVPEYGRTLRSGARVSLDRWRRGESVSDFVRRMIGPPPPSSIHVVQDSIGL